MWSNYIVLVARRNFLLQGLEFGPALRVVTLLAFSGPARGEMLDGLPSLFGLTNGLQKC